MREQMPNDPFPPDPLDAPLRRILAGDPRP